MFIVYKYSLKIFFPLKKLFRSYKINNIIYIFINNSILNNSHSLQFQFKIIYHKYYYLATKN